MTLEHVGKLFSIVNNFEDFAVEHFLTRARDILRACNAYMEVPHVEVWMRLLKSLQKLEFGAKD
ncbi:hypothetical protein MTR_1g016840 [Medicago truncatula]|uniref:Uncharacterized protein n=1 Tax=Medicago truncatula TaxID=3880 RepID=A0A072VED6_MEDTR|nr:hypothetical protein MTR_1g016840 [Medicago truncatula]